ncbi:MAG: SRPBCC family protein [Actinobacteria bacterium]|nr:SRPBCC family protein [Actinomycetota bacterium]
MDIATGFELAKPVEDAWPLLTDLERVAPCMPGVRVESVNDDGLEATMRVKVGPVTVSYRTEIAIESLDEATRTAVLRARGREARGPGTVEATVTAVMSGNGDHTTVDLKTDLAVTGKVAQFGGGVMTEVADRLLRQFAERLEADLATEAEAPANGAINAEAPAGASGPAAAVAGAGEPAAAAPDRHEPEPEPADLGSIAGQVLAPRLAAAAAVIAALAAVLVLLRRRA